jgi:protein angel
LAQNLLEDNSYLYTHARQEWLAWTYRQKNLIAEIAHHQPDILCCQEINEEHYTDFFYPEMQKLGYQGAYKKRTRNMHDGCATFFKTSSFECDAVVPVEYLKPGIPVLDRDNVALLLLLQPKLQLGSGASSRSSSASASKLCVANTHLLFNPRRGDVKLAQLMTLFAEIDRLAFRGTGATASVKDTLYHPVVFCGDLNMEPFSGLYEFVSRGSLHVEEQNIRGLSGQEERSRFKSGDRPMSRSFLDRNAGITDQSQYVSVFNHRSDVLSGKVSSAAAEEPESRVPVGGAAARPEANWQAPFTMLPFTQGSGTISHGFHLKSVYSHFANNGGRRRRSAGREVTTSHDRANCTVDYIFYTAEKPSRCQSETDLSSLWTADEEMCMSSSRKRKNPKDDLAIKTHISGSNSNRKESSLQLLSRLELISDHDMKEIGGLPNELISSDHLILAAKFLLK